ncbi:hypothetical protein Cgig2_030807 [Carnegiea gigantea]|uniref:Uncharacterized protein n=1 Tax=Carnegiea gigantea TaxID=171969 RepID=A0A9Q1QPG4_9CARY|nr:hypothetical protein Cgig2_030807 [Carnegiea gigantea]
METGKKVTGADWWLTRPGLGLVKASSKRFSKDLQMGFIVHALGSLASGFEITTPNEIHEVADPEKGFTLGEIQPPEVPPNSGIWTSFRDCLSWTTKAKRFKPHQPRPSENAEPEPEPELEPPHDDDYGEVKEAKGLPKVTLATQMVLPAAVGWVGYFVIGQGALYNPAFAFSVFGVHTLGTLSMFFGWYLGTKSPRVSERMQKLGQALCIARLNPHTDPRFQQAQVLTGVTAASEKALLSELIGFGLCVRVSYHLSTLGFTFEYYLNGGVCVLSL